MNHQRKKFKILSVVGARPNFVKIMPIIQASRKVGLKNILVHTGQHYDYRMSAIFFKDLNIPKPDVYLGAGSDSHARQTAKIMTAFESVLLKEKPSLVLVVGDVNSTIACALTAVKLHIPVAHVEAGLRSFDMKMPEEVNRILTDRISDYLFTPSTDANKNLLNEGIKRNKIFLVGNIMIDTLLKFKSKAELRKTYARFGLENKKYVLLTMHRPENVDNKKYLVGIFAALKAISRKTPVVFPVHPRTGKNMSAFGLEKYIRNSKIALIKPIGYLDFLNLTIHARCVLTDSGGIQEETSVLKIPCLTLRENTERPITVWKGTNIVVGTDKDAIVCQVNKILEGKIKKPGEIELWDGNTAQRIIRIIKEAEY